VTISRLPSGRYRVQVWDAALGRNVSAAQVIGGGPRSFRTYREARAAEAKAYERLGEARSGVTVAEFRERWITDRLFERPKESTNIHNAERTKAFADKYGDVPIDQIGDEHVGQWLAGGRRNAQVPALRAMFNDARSAKAGRLLTTNPFAGLGIAKTKGNKHVQPPNQEQMWAMLDAARRLTPPSFVDWLETACFTGMRPGELDALQFSQIRWADEEIDVTVQWNVKAKAFTEPKYGRYTIALVGHARETLLRARSRRDTDAPYVFPTLRGTHYTPSSRTHHWNRVRVGAGLPETTTLYLATRHYFGWYAMNVLLLDAATIATQLGHRDGGQLVEQLYGHPDARLRRNKLRQAFDATAKVHPLRVVGDRS